MKRFSDSHSKLCADIYLVNLAEKQRDNKRENVSHFFYIILQIYIIAISYLLALWF